MAKAWMPMYWGDYLADTIDFNRADHGSYLLLIAYYWCNGGLPNDDNTIRRIAKCSVKGWPRLKETLQRKFSQEWKHKRIDKEIAQAIERSNQARCNSNARWHPSGNANHNHNHKESKKERETRTGVRGTRLEKDWWPSIEDCRYAQSHGLDGDRLNIETEKFRNYWTSKTGRDATKLDWSATWQNWVLRAGERQNGNGRYERKSTLVEIGERLAADAEALERAGNLGPADDPIRGD